MSNFPSTTIDHARKFLKGRFDADPSTVEPAGEGAWSICYGFKRNGEELVIRFGNHEGDFQKDRYASVFAAPGLPIPKVIEIGQAFDGCFAVSTRVRGRPLESLAREEWSAAVPAVASTLEALRLAGISSTAGFGMWGGQGDAPYQNWSEYLLNVGEDTPNKRIHGWWDRLSQHAKGEAAFRWGYDMLQGIAKLTVPRCLIHGDLINRNVLVEDNTITGVFDWGCSAYGDHLYDLAWFDFWAPWYPNLNVNEMKLELESRWSDAGYLPANREARLLACHLHIGLDHLAYNAFAGNYSALSETAERMKTLISHG